MKCMLSSKEMISHWDELTYLDADQRDDDLFQSLGMLAGHRLL